MGRHNLKHKFATTSKEADAAFLKCRHSWMGLACLTHRWRHVNIELGTDQKSDCGAEACVCF